MNILIFIAALPVVLICLYVYKKDTEKEPKTLLKKLMLWGCFSIIPVIVVELILDVFFKVTGSEAFLKIFIYCFVGIGLIEELAKWIISYKVVYKNSEFNEAYDAIVYCVFASLGFALVENILYVLSNGVVTGVLRAFTSVPAHTCNGVVMGYYLGKAKKAEIENDIGSSKRNMFFSILMSSALHTLYDTLVFSKMHSSIYLFIACTLSLYIISIVLIKKVSKNNTKFTNALQASGSNFKYALVGMIMISVVMIAASVFI